MSYRRYLRELLAPLRLYDLEAPFNGGELNVQGGALDGVDTWLAELRRESTLAEAESWGLERIIALLARRPVADTPTGMRKALAALMRIGGDSFTLEAINATISGCGVHAHVEEKEIPGEVGSPSLTFQASQRDLRRSGRSLRISCQPTWGSNMSSGILHGRNWRERSPAGRRSKSAS